MKVKYLGETKDVKTTNGKDARLESGMTLDCMEKEYHSGTTVRTILANGEHVKVKRSELIKT